MPRRRTGARIAVVSALAVTALLATFVVASVVTFAMHREEGW